MNARNIFLALLLATTVVSSSGCGLAALASTGLVFWAAVDLDQDEDDPPPEPLPDLGSAWLEPAASTVAPSDTVQVTVYIYAGDTITGSYSVDVDYNQSAFTLETVTGPESPMGDPFAVENPSPGKVYIAGMNAATPLTTASGEMKVAVLTFRATGSTGATLNLSGRLLNLGDTTFPAADIGTGAMPRTMTANDDVVIGE